MKKIIVLFCFSMLMLSGCSNGADETAQERIAQLEAENAALKAEKNQNTETTTMQMETEATTQEKNNQEISLGETVAIDDVCEFSVVDFKFSKRVDPSNPDSFYTYYETKDVNTKYLDLVLSYKNLEANAIGADDVASVSLLYNSKYTYNSFDTIEKADGSDFCYTNITSIDPLTSGKLHYLCEVPNEVETGESVVATITVAGNEYIFAIK